MRIPFSWLSEFIGASFSPGDVVDRLTMIGFEVEATEAVGSDVVFEVNVTPNRPDCLSIIGIARELAAVLESPLTVPHHEIEDIQPASGFFVEILDTDLCNRYAGRVITGVSVAQSPEWIRTRLEKCGIRSINNIVDVTNYVLLEFGHPLHAFDAELLVGNVVRVGTPLTLFGERRQVRMFTLDGAEREIPSDTLLIWDGEKPVAVAGVMGGLNTEVTERTKDIFLESAYFDPVSIRVTSKRLGLSSESSYRFERGTDIEFLEHALDRAAGLIREIAGGTIHGKIDAYPVRYVPTPIRVRAESIQRTLGIRPTDAEIVGILERLGIPSEHSNGEIIVSPPARRRDLAKTCDIAEEVARLVGFDKIPTTLPRSPLSSGKIRKRAERIQLVRETMRKAGFSAAINYSFMNGASLDMLDIPPDDKRRDTVVISNPLSQDETLLRTTLIPSLIANLKYNLDRGATEIRLFEVSTIFENIGRTLPSEPLRLGGVWCKENLPTLWREETPGFFVTKGALETLFDELKIARFSYAPSAEPFLHAGKSADISIAGSKIGFIGVPSPHILDRLDLKKRKVDIVIFELDLELLLDSVPDAIQFCPLPKYPAIERDIAIAVDETIPAARISEIISSFSTELIEAVSVFDFFKGGAIPHGKKSLAFHIVYRAHDRTLTDSEVEAIHAKLTQVILERTSGTLRS